MICATSSGVTASTSVLPPRDGRRDFSVEKTCRPGQTEVREGGGGWRHRLGKCALSFLHKKGREDGAAGGFPGRQHLTAGLGWGALALT